MNSAINAPEFAQACAARLLANIELAKHRKT
jgi:hypothetical protein